MDTFIAKRIWRNRQSGMSLIEVVIAIVILGGVVSALMTTLVTASTSSKSHR
ncbi:MAG: type II secretion system protein, partial [Terriglobales bacterium]